MRLDELHQQEQSAEEWIENISHHCSEMLNAYKSSGGILYRGIGDEMGNRQPIVSGTIRQDRRPSATPEANHEIISQALAKLKLPTKKNTIACSTQRKLAAEWGPVYVLFLKNGWTGLTFDHHDFDDLYVQSELVLRKHGDVNDMAVAITKMRPIKITPANLAQQIEKKVPEIIFTGSSYFAINPKSALGMEILSGLKVAQ